MTHPGGHLQTRLIIRTLDLQLAKLVLQMRLIEYNIDLNSSPALMAKFDALSMQIRYGETARDEHCSWLVETKISRQQELLTT